MDFLHTILGPDIKAGLLIILNLIVIESLLSVDNAAVLATMVMDLPKDQRKRALKYGIIGAYVFRGICLFLAAWLVKIWWLKPLGGIYLLYLAFDFFRKRRAKNGPQQEEQIDKSKSWFYKNTVGLVGTFWATVALVEVMDLAFSIDNVFAAVAFTDHIYLIYIGVFIGILAMRFVAQAFVRLMEKFTFLETAAFTVIGVLGLKLTSSLVTHFFPESPVSHLIDSEKTDLFVSIFTVAIFVLPIASSLLFNFPKKNKTHDEIEAEEKEAGKSALNQDQQGNKQA
ncbi:TerC family protein [Pedobacter cryoconitis]|uniref:YkoY family integral membrane protein n=1 Tax=Pedobacter cryoconitis TaxID=188932 RepID=A0A327SQF9_9SPHI|nr:TerC family protein [Pedobacter cryoconitis]RAJ31088.1 YkoY family integral membrane protein [Pedobacter cryoconitis]